MKKSIVLFVVLAVICVSGCATLGGNIEKAEADLNSIEKVVAALDTVGWVDGEQ